MYLKKKLSIYKVYNYYSERKIFFVIFNKFKKNQDKIFNLM